MADQERKLGIITPSYTGNYCERMTWRDDLMNGFVRAADLRTNVVIVQDERNPEHQVSDMGDILIWRKFGNPLDTFKSPTTVNGFVSTAVDYYTGRGAIYIHHRVITDFVQKRSQGRFDGGLFVEEVDRSVNQGLGQVLAKEKINMAFNSGLCAAGFGICFGVTLFFAHAYFNHYLSDWLMSSFEIGAKDDQFISYVHTLDTLAGIVFLRYGSINLCKILQESQIWDGPSLYVQSNTDVFNPLRPVGTFMKGSGYLANEGKNIVEYRQP